MQGESTLRDNLYPSNQVVKGVSFIQRYDPQRAIIAYNVMTQFTRTEYNLFITLLSGLATPDQRLFQALGARSDDRSLQKTLERHIEKMREKLRPTNLLIKRITKYGYILVSKPEASVYQDRRQAHEHHMGI